MEETMMLARMNRIQKRRDKKPKEKFEGNMCGSPQARAPERGTGPKEQVAGPRGMDPLVPVPEYLILHHSWSRGVSVQVL